MSVIEKEIKLTRSMLVVDDDTEQCSVIKRHAATFDVEVQTANSGHSALALIQGNPEKYFLILTDQSMPGMDGDVLLDRVKAQWPHIRRAMISGDETGEAIKKAYESGDLFQYIRKPAGDETIKSFLRDACSHALSVVGNSEDIVKRRKELLNELIEEVYANTEYGRIYRGLGNEMLLHSQKMCESYGITRLPLIEIEKDAFKQEFRVAITKSLKQIMALLHTSSDAKQNFTIASMMRQFNITKVRPVDRSLPFNEALFASFINRFITFYDLVGLDRKKVIKVTENTVIFGAGDRYIYNDIFNPVLASVHKGLEIACLQLEAVMILVALKLRGEPELVNDEMQIVLKI